MSVLISLINEATNNPNHLTATTLLLNTRPDGVITPETVTSAFDWLETMFEENILNEDTYINLKTMLTAETEMVTDLSKIDGCSDLFQDDSGLGVDLNLGGVDDDDDVDFSSDLSDDDF